MRSVLDFASLLRRNAAFGGFAALAGLATAPVLRIGGRWTETPLWLLLVAAALLVTAFSAHLLFDAMLFRLMASFPDEMAGGRAVDDFLARTGLRAPAPDLRSLADRIDGTRRILKRQRIALAIFIALLAAFAFLPDAYAAAGSF